MRQVEWSIQKRDFFPVSREELFMYWINPELLEKWACPDGMTLQVPQMEAYEGGHYRFETTNKEGKKYTCLGTFKSYTPNEKMEQVETVYGPDGKAFFENLNCIVDFVSVNGGCEVIIHQKGFKDERSTKMCELSWNQTLEKLNILLSESISSKSEGHVYPDAGKYTSFY